MAGGGFKEKNKVLPGAYVNVVSNGQPKVNETEKGVVFTVTQGLKWGADGVVEVNATSDFVSLFGVPIDDKSLTALRHILLQAKKVYVFNFNHGYRAVGVVEVLPWYLMAKYAGTRGNDLKVVVTPDPNAFGKYTVQTYFDADLVDTQVVSKASDLQDNEFFTTAVSGLVEDNGLAMLSALTTPVVINFKSGTDEKPVTQVDELIEAIETHDFNVLTAAGQDPTAAIHQLFATTVIRLREELGRKVQAVIPEMDSYKPNHEGVIVVANGVRLSDGTVLTPTLAAAFVAGAESSAEANQSLTYVQFPNAVDAVPRYNEEKQISKIRSGAMVFVSSRGAVKILSDINSLTTFTDSKNQEFSKNRVLRVLDDIANNTRETWEDHFIGKITNDSTGRDLFKANRAEYLGRLQQMGAIEDFDPSADVTISAGDTKDSVLAEIVVKPTDAMEKLYLTVRMN